MTIDKKPAAFTSQCQFKSKCAGACDSPRASWWTGEYRM